MGKIFDALEKSKKAPQTAPTADRGSEQVSPPAKGKAIFPGNGKTALFLEAFSKAAGSAKGNRVAPVAAGHPRLHEIRADNNLITVSKPRSFEAEQFKILRTNLLFPAHGRPARSLMVTSALAAEGKSFFAANLAVSISQNINGHVLLIDCDLRKPSIDQIFGLDNPVGLSEYLCGSIPLSSLLVKTGIHKLNILPAGQRPDNPAELLSSQKMLNLLAEVKARYSDRFVIIDSPPPKLTAEATAIAKQVEKILIIVKSGSTPRAAVKQLVGCLEKEKIIGVALNWFDVRSTNYHSLGTYRNIGRYYSEA